MDGTVLRWLTFNAPNSEKGHSSLAKEHAWLTSESLECNTPNKQGIRRHQNWRLLGGR